MVNIFTADWLKLHLGAASTSRSGNKSVGMTDLENTTVEAGGESLKASMKLDRVKERKPDSHGKLVQRRHLLVKPEERN